MSGGTLVIGNTIEVDNTFTIANGVLAGGTILPGSSGQGVTLTYGTLNDLTVDASVAMHGGAQIINGMTVNGTITLTNSSTMTFDNSQSLGGTGTIMLGDQSNNTIAAVGTGSTAATLTIGPGVLIHGYSGTIGYNNNGPGTTITNQGTIDCDEPGAQIVVNVSAGISQNTGTLKAMNGGTIQISGTGWSNVGGTFEADAGSRFVIATPYKNINQTLQLVGGGTFQLNAGSIEGGIISIPAGTTFLPAGGTLYYTTIDGNFTGGAAIAYGLTLNGTVTLTNGANLAFYGSQTLNGNATIFFGDTSNNVVSVVGSSSAATLTLASTVLIHGYSGTVGYTNNGPGATIVNQGVIDSDEPGAQIVVNVSAGTSQNTGTLKAMNGGTIQISGTGWSNVGGTFEADAGSRFVIATQYQNANESLLLSGGGTFQLNAGSIVDGSVSVPAGTTFAPAGGVLYGITYNGDFTGGATIAYGFTLNGTITLTNSTKLAFYGSQTFNGNGTILFGDQSNNFVSVVGTGPAATLTIGPSVLIHGFSGTVGDANTGQGATIVNQGIIESDEPGAQISLNSTAGTSQNTGTIKATNGGTLAITSGQWSNYGTIECDAGSIFNISGLFSLNANTTLTGSGTTNLLGVMTGDPLTIPEAATFNLQNGTLSGITIDGNIQSVFNGTAAALILNGNLTVQHYTFNIVSGLTLNGTLTLQPAASYDTSTLAVVTSGTITGSGTINELGQSVITVNSSGSQTTLTVGPSIVINCQYGGIQSNDATGLTQLINEGTIQTAINESVPLQVATTNLGTIAVGAGGTLSDNQSLKDNAQGSISAGVTSSLSTSASIVGNSTNVSRSNWYGNISFANSGNHSAPTQLEAMSQDQGAVLAGYVNNFAINSLALSNEYLQLIDSSHNSNDTAAEAVYVSSIYVRAGSTLDLNALHLYARSAAVQGSVINGSISILPPGGSLQLAQPVAGTIPTGGTNSWTFYGQAGQSIRAILDPGSGAYGAPLPQTLSQGQISLLAPGGTILATQGSTSNNTPLVLSVGPLAVAGSYTVVIQAAASNPSATGNYTLVAFDVTPIARGTIVPNQQENGSISAPYATDSWSLTAAAGTQIQFQLASASSSYLMYSLTGPNGYTAFTTAQTSSGPIILPSNGTYTLTAQDVGAATGSYSFDIAETTLTMLSPGTPYSAVFAGSGQAAFFEIPLTSAGPLTITLSDGAATDHEELYARFGSEPTLQSYDYSASASGSGQSIVIPSASAGNWYVLALGEYVASANTSYSIAAYTGVTVSGTNTTSGVLGATNTLTLSGAGFSPGMTVSLVASNGQTYPAMTTSTNLPTQLTAIFFTGSVPSGTYTIDVTQSNGQTYPFNNLRYNVLGGGEAHLSTNLELPDPMTLHVAQTIYIDYTNDGTAAMQAPLLILDATTAQGNHGALLTLNPHLQGPGLFSSATPPGFSESIELLGSGASPGLLQPGESEHIPVYYAGWLQSQWGQGPLTFTLQVVEPGDPTPINWASLQSSLQPPSINNAAWSTIFGNLQSQMGSTAGGYVRLLDDQESYLSGLGENVTSVSALWGLAVEEADNALSPLAPYLDSQTDLSLPTVGSLPLSFSRNFAEPISGRDIISTLGMGWSTPWQITATTNSDGSVTVNEPGGGQRIFDPSAIYSGQYFSQPGDTGTLSSDGSGGYLLTEAGGNKTDFTSAGLLNYMQDTDGNRITAGYSNGRLASLTATSGQFLNLSYNAAGLISTVSDSTGRSISYGYDPSNTYLTSLTSYTGQVTSYTYNTTGGADQNALTSIAFPGGTHQYFTYDSQGRITSTYGDGGASPQTFSYSLGQVNVTDGTGDTSVIDYNENGQVARSIDPLGNPTYYAYDGNYNLVSITNSAGQLERFSYNSVGHVTSSRDFLGNVTSYTYGGPNNQLTRFTDANGNPTSYAYNTNGDLLSTTYADGTMSTATFNPLGEATSFINQNGQPITYTYNAAGQILTEGFSDGTSYTYTYDLHGNLLTATDSTGTTTFTYDPTTERMTEVQYPVGLYLKFSYNTAGQRTHMMDQTGFTTNYMYDSNGRLHQLTDANNNVVVTYTYDADGRLSKKVNGNGTYSTYTYDANDNVLTLYNYAPSGAVNSSFVYTYNNLSLQTTETTIDGVWAYGYDADGQLISAVFAPDAADPDGVTAQNLAYHYDAMGNRTSTMINGVTTSYVVNNMNQYTSVGGVPYAYDRDGNLLSDGISTYTYNESDQLARITGQSGETTFYYGPLGLLASTTAANNGGTVQSVIDPFGSGNVVAAFSSPNPGAAGTLSAEYRYGLGLASKYLPQSGSSFYDFDQLGNVISVTNALGNKGTSYSYQPYGALLSSTSSASDPFQFLGQYGVQYITPSVSYMRARFFSNSTGRFATTDPIGINGGTNIYRYSLNNPVQYVDPTGHSTLGRVIVAGAVLGAIVYFGFPILVFSVGIDLGIGITSSITAASIAVAPAVQEFLVDEATGGWEVATVAVDTAIDQFDSDREQPPTTPTSNPDFIMFLATKTIDQADESLKLPEFGAPDKDPFVATTDTRSSSDPNALYGPSGFGSSNFLAGTHGLLPYQIDFENSPTATAPVQEIVISDQLSSNLNWSTFQLTGINFGNVTLAIPNGTQSYQTTAPFTWNGVTFNIQITSGIHTATGQVYATFVSIDPGTGLPPSNALVGFLPPEDGSGRGEGYITYTISPVANLATGTQITNVAYISFDGQTPIATDQVNDEDPAQGISTAKQALVTIDSGAPTSSVYVPPQAIGSSSFTVDWTGQDDAGGSGVATYSVYISTDGGAYTLWQSNSSSTSAVFAGQPGYIYSFYSVAIDNVGNVQSISTDAQAVAVVGQSIYLRPDADGQQVDIWNNTSGTGSFNSSSPVSAQTVLTVLGIAGNDSLTIDASNGVAMPVGGFSYSVPSGQSALTETGGEVQFTSLSIAAGGKLSFMTPARTLLRTASLSIAGSSNAWTGTLDLRGNDLDVSGGDLAVISNQIASGYANGTWAGTGIDSSTAGSDTTHLTALGSLQNSDGSGSPLYGSGTTLGLLDGTSAALNDVLVRYTYFGDATLDGKVDGSDYSRIDSGYLSHLTGWVNGDFNYDGIINGSDYTLIDNAFNTQGAALAALISSPQTFPTAAKTKSAPLTHQNLVSRSVKSRTGSTENSPAKKPTSSFAPNVFSSSSTLISFEELELVSQMVEKSSTQGDVLDLLTSDA